MVNEDVSKFEVAPIFFRKLGDSQGYIVSNQLARWSLLKNEAELHKLVASPESLSNFDELVSLGFLIEASEHSIKHYAAAAETYLTKKFKYALDRPSLVMVVPTLRCDHKCSYCQVSRAPLDSASHDNVLEPEAVANFIDSIASPTFKLEFQGGEPLLDQAWIHSLTRELRKLRGDKFRLVICSALGPEITDEFIYWALEEDVQFSVSYDGHQDLHDKFRLHTQEVGTAQRTLSKARELVARGLNVSFVSTLTRESVQRGAERYVDCCVESGINRIYSRPIAEYGFAATTIRTLGVSEDEYLKFFRELLDQQIARFQTNVEFIDESIIICLKRIYQPLFTRHVDAMSPSGYALSACLINYDGNVFGSDEARMLFESTKNKHLPIGSITANKFARNHTSLHAELLANSFIETKTHCETCAYQPFCGLDPIGIVREQEDASGHMPTLSQCQITLGIYDAIFERISNGALTQAMVKRWLVM